MAGVSTNAVAIVALFSVLVAAQPVNSAGWLPAKATWYGAPTGAGPDDNGGACGFKNVNQYPFMSMTSCGNEPLFKDGMGCGSCYQVVALVALFSLLVTYASAGTPYSSAWLPAKATWYGAPTGAGPDDNGGACGFKGVNQYPFMSMTSCGNEPLFNDGKGCGSCYQIRCHNDPACSGKPETVIITDMNYYPVAKYHFDLSGTAFGALAKPGLNDKLRHAGIIDIQFRRVPCNYPGLNVNFHVEDGSNPVYFAVLVEYENRDGDVVQVDLMESKSAYGGPTGVWTPMHESWGSIWRLDSNHRLQAPFSLRIRSDSGKTLVANQVIPANWAPNTNYRSIVQFR